MLIFAVRLQKGVGTNDRMFFSRISRYFKVGPCTLPVLNVAYCPLLVLAAKVNALERLIP